MSLKRDVCGKKMMIGYGDLIDTHGEHISPTALDLELMDKCKGKFTLGHDSLGPHALMNHAHYPVFVKEIAHMAETYHSYRDLEGLLHRLDGPAIVDEQSGYKAWWVHGECLLVLRRS